MTTEVRCAEIDLEDLGPKGIKELLERLLKTLKMTNAFCSIITKRYHQAKSEEIKILNKLEHPQRIH